MLKLQSSLFFVPQFEMFLTRIVRGCDVYTITIIINMTSWHIAIPGYLPSTSLTGHTINMVYAIFWFDDI